MSLPGKSPNTLTSSPGKKGQHQACWKPVSVMIDVAVSVYDDTLQKVNLIDCIGHSTCFNKDTLDSHQCYWLPRKYSQNDQTFRSKEVIPLFTNACHEAGFALATHGWEAHPRNTLRFQCQRSRVYDKDSIRKYKKLGGKSGKIIAKTTSRPVKGTEDVKCPFKFNIHWHPQKQRWFFLKQGRGCPEHHGHSHYTSNWTNTTNRVQKKELDTTCMTSLEADATDKDNSKDNSPPAGPATVAAETKPIIRSNKEKLDAHGQLYPMFAKLTDVIQTEKQLEDIRKLLHHGMDVVLGKPRKRKAPDMS